MAELDGTWQVERLGGVLPPLWRVRKRIEGEQGATIVGWLSIPFGVEGLRFRYRPPMQGFVDLLEPDRDGYVGRATFLGREFGRFRLTRLS
jgi:hypothetical protein